MKRRVFVKGSLAASTLAVAAGAGLLSPTRVLAAAWPENAFGQRPEADALNAFFGTSEVTESDQVALKAPLQAENGAVVPIKVMTTLPNVESIAVVVEKNPAPFTTGLEVMGGGAGALAGVTLHPHQSRHHILSDPDPNHPMYGDLGALVHASAVITAVAFDIDFHEHRSAGLSDWRKEGIQVPTRRILRLVAIDAGVFVGSNARLQAGTNKHFV